VEEASDKVESSYPRVGRFLAGILPFIIWWGGVYMNAPGAVLLDCILIFALFPAFLAAERGRNFWLWSILGLFLLVVAYPFTVFLYPILLLLALFSPTVEKSKGREPVWHAAFGLCLIQLTPLLIMLVSSDKPSFEYIILMGAMLAIVSLSMSIFAHKSELSDKLVTLADLNLNMLKYVAGLTLLALTGIGLPVAALGFGLVGVWYLVRTVIIMHSLFGKEIGGTMKVEENEV